MSRMVLMSKVVRLGSEGRVGSWATELAALLDSDRRNEEIRTLTSVWNSALDRFESLCTFAEVDKRAEIESMWAI